MQNLTIPQIQEKVAEGSLTYEGLTAFYIHEINRHNEGVNAIAEMNPNALSQAKALDQEREAQGIRSPLHGIPILIKDNINIATDGFHTTAGAVALQDFKAPYDATIVKKLREAGAIILGKTNLSEFANFISETSPNGYSALKGQVINPYGPFDVGGSSSGSGVAVACDFCQVAIGTETSGSIISPASSNGVIGLKPTVGVVSRYGIIPISATQDVPGPMARHIEDVAIVQEVIEGFDAGDLTTSAYLKLEGQRYSPNQEPMPQYTLGIYKDKKAAPEQQEAETVFREALKKLKEAGIKQVKVDFNEKDYTIDWDVLYYEFPRDMATYLATVTGGTDFRTLEDIVHFNQRDLEHHVPYDQKQFDISLEKQSRFEDDYGRALKDSFHYGGLIDLWLEDQALDAVAYVNCDGVDIGARRGHPSITIPIGQTKEGAPVGFTITGAMYSEPKLLKMAEHLLAIIGEVPQIKGKGNTASSTGH